VEKEIQFEEIVQKYKKMIWKIVKKYKSSYKTGYELDELYQFGLFGLWKAYENFDPTKNCKFSTYAYINISGYIRSELNKEKEIDLTRSDVKKKEEVAKLIKMKEEKNWTWEETWRKSGLSLEE
jgi:RNA polymerase sigma factor FliA